MNGINGFRSISGIQACLFTLIMGAVALFTSTAQAQTTNVIWGLGSTGYWTNGPNWNTGVAPVDGDSVSINSNVTSGCTVILNQSINTLGLSTLTISNLSGTTTLVITQGVSAATLMLTNGTAALNLRSGGRLEIDNGGTLVISGCVRYVSWVDTNGLIYLNQGGLITLAGSTGGSQGYVFSGLTNQICQIATKTPIGGIWDFGGRWLGIGAVSGTYSAGTNCLILNGVIITNTAAGIGSSYANYTSNNGLILSNGAVCCGIAASSQTTIGGGTGNNNYMILGGTNGAGQPATFCNQSRFNIGGAGGAGTNNGVWVGSGGLITNVGYVGVGAYQNYSYLVVTNGGQIFNQGYVGSGMTNCRAIVTGPGSLWESTGGNLYLGSYAAGMYGANGPGSNNWLLVQNGGWVRQQASGSTLFVGQNGTTDAGSSGNYVQVTSGGVLEFNTMSVSNALGNYVTNWNGGVYQFTGTPTFNCNPVGSPAVYMNGGVVSFRNNSTADVKGNWTNSLTNITWVAGAANIFRLNNATNSNASGQTYTFDSGMGSTNYYRLEMINGSTRYRGLPSDSLTIGATVGSGGQMLCSNTTAQVDLVFTNNGTLTIENSALILTNSAVMNGVLVIDLNNLTSAEKAGSAVIQASNLTLKATSSLILTGTGTNMTLMTIPGTLNGTFGSITAPLGCAIQYGTGSNSSISLRKVPVGTSILIQ